jgi:hypothetical protein
MIAGLGDGEFELFYGVDPRSVFQGKAAGDQPDYRNVFRLIGYFYGHFFLSHIHGSIPFIVSKPKNGRFDSARRRLWYNPAHYVDPKRTSNQSDYYSGDDGCGRV